MRKFFARWYRTEMMWRERFAMEVIRRRHLNLSWDGGAISGFDEPVFNMRTGEIEIYGGGVKITTTLSGDTRYAGVVL